MLKLELFPFFSALQQCDGYLYDETRPLARGSTATVQVALDPEAKRVVAVKLLNRCGPDEHYEVFASRLAQLKTETEVYNAVLGQDAAAVEHIIETLGANTDPAAPRQYHVMPLADGSLRDLIREHRQLGAPPTAGQALQLVDHIARGLSAAHRAGYIHRDVKPENVLLFCDGRGSVTARVADFGIAKFSQDQTTQQRSAPPIGTWGYMSPEQIERGRERAVEGSDVWSLGVVAYELFVLSRCWVSDDDALKGWTADTGGVAAQHWAETSRLRALDDWFTRCLAAKPRERFGSPVEACAALREALDKTGSDLDQPLVTGPIGPRPAGPVPESADSTTKGVVIGLPERALPRLSGGTPLSDSTPQHRRATRDTRRRPRWVWALGFGAVGLSLSISLWRVSLQKAPSQMARSLEPAVHRPAASRWPLPLARDAGPPDEAVSQPEPEAPAEPPAQRSSPPEEEGPAAAVPAKSARPAEKREAAGGKGQKTTTPVATPVPTGASPKGTSGPPLKERPTKPSVPNPLKRLKRRIDKQTSSSL